MIAKLGLPAAWRQYPPLLIAALFVSPLVSGALALWTLDRERLTRMAEQRLEDQTTLHAATGEDSGIVNAPPLPPAPTARLLLADALYVARRASYIADSSPRGALLDRARKEAMAGLSQRPHWGEAWVTIAYIESLRTKPSTEAIRAALVRSYADAPFLEQAGFWRVGRALSQWNDLSPGTRNKVVAEAAWLLRYGEPAKQAALFELARRSPAYRQIFLRWRKI